jgi:hypothetical protein
MSTLPSGQIALSDFRNTLGPGGTNTVYLKDYYQNATTYYASGISGIANTGTNIGFSAFRGKAKYVPAVQGWAHQFGSVGTGASQSGLYFSYLGSINAVFRLKTSSGTVLSASASLTINVVSGNFKGPDLQVALSTPYTGEICLERSDNAGASWREVARATINNASLYTFWGGNIGD